MFFSLAQDYLEKPQIESLCGITQENGRIRLSRSIGASLRAAGPWPVECDCRNSLEMQLLES